ncbi:VPS37B subunit of ESCRT-I b [Chanos chanos]|uniref:VPS37B subunit of ESCRT-I b n=1 Tax=Chanos chanos TaxID=29144 RepID=A0A6J2UW18_CHACN|nr:vacuolar protein sorting-associated protein 37B-like [Chanos chanos]
MGEIPEIANKFSSYSVTQLNELLEDDDKLNKIVSETDKIQEVQQTKEMTLASNRSLAEQNLSLQPALDQQRILLTKRYMCLQELFEAYQFRKSTFDCNSQNSSLDTLLALLQAEGAKIEEETENMADLFLEGQLSLDSFIDEYQSKRKLAHLRRVKIDKLEDVVLRGLQLPCAPVTKPQEGHVSPTQPTNGTPVPAPRRTRHSPPLSQQTSQTALLPYPAIP